MENLFDIDRKYDDEQENEFKDYIRPFNLGLLRMLRDEQTRHLPDTMKTLIEEAFLKRERSVNEDDFDDADSDVYKPSNYLTYPNTKEHFNLNVSKEHREGQINYIIQHIDIVKMPESARIIREAEKLLNNITNVFKHVYIPIIITKNSEEKNEVKSKGKKLNDEVAGLFNIFSPRIQDLKVHKPSRERRQTVYTAEKQENSQLHASLLMMVQELLADALTNHTDITISVTTNKDAPDEDITSLNVYPNAAMLAAAAYYNLIGDHDSVATIFKNLCKDSEFNQSELEVQDYTPILLLGLEKNVVTKNDINFIDQNGSLKYKLVIYDGEISNHKLENKLIIKNLTHLRDGKYLCIYETEIKDRLRNSYMLSGDLLFVSSELSMWELSFQALLRNAFRNLFDIISDMQESAVISESSVYDALHESVESCGLNLLAKTFKTNLIISSPFFNALLQANEKLKINMNVLYRLILLSKTTRVYDSNIDVVRSADILTKNVILQCIICTNSSLSN